MKPFTVVDFVNDISLQLALDLPYYHFIYVPSPHNISHATRAFTILSYKYNTYIWSLSIDHVISIKATLASNTPSNAYSHFNPSASSINANYQV